MNVRFERLYNIWTLMKGRCYNPNNHCYKYYGARGISVADCWLHDYSAFKQWALNNGYKDELTIERIDNDKGYSPDNCKWIAKGKQTLNRRMNLYFTYQGKTKCLSEWCIELGLSEHYGNIKRRIVELGMSFKKAISTPIKDTSSVDISGNRYGRLTAISFSRKVNKKYYWLCKCDCGNTKEVRKDHLISGNVKSCGCLHDETFINMINKTNNEVNH